MEGCTVRTLSCECLSHWTMLLLYLRQPQTKNHLCDDKKNKTNNNNNGDENHGTSALHETHNP